MARRNFAWIALVFLILTFGLVCNWSYRYEEVARVGQVSMFTASLPSGATAVEKTMAGWPLKYYVAMSVPNARTFSTFSLMRLVGNIGTWLAIFGFAIAYEAVKMRRGKQAEKRSSARQVTIGDLLLTMLLVAAALMYWQTLKSRAKVAEDLATRIKAQRGDAILIANLPAPWSQWVPDSLKGCFLRVANVTLDAPDDELLEQVMQLGQLESLGIGGGDYNLRLLDSLAAKPFLRDLRISGRRIDAELLSAIGSAKQLQSLSLMRTDVSTAGLAGLGPMPSLQFLDLTHTDIELSDADVPQWASNLRSIYLPRPAAGNEGKVHIEGWPELESIRCSEYDELANRSVVQLQLRNLPKLKSVTLDSLQLFDLELAHLPLLEAVDTAYLQIEQRVASGDAIPSFPWIRNLQITDTPALRNFSTYGTDTERISIQDMPQAEFGVCVMPVGASQLRGVRGRFQDEPSQIPHVVRQAWIDGLAGSQGPPSVDYSYIPLEGLDLSPIRSNPLIRMLDLSHTGIDEKQVLSLAGIPQLEELRLMGTQIEGGTVAQLVDKLPQLRQLHCEPMYIGRLKLENRPNLEKIIGESEFEFGYSSMDALHLSNMPRLADVFEMAPHALYVHLDDVQSLKGLVFHAELPERVSISGLRDLQIFAGGGRRLGDDLAGELLACKDLRKLTLAHSGVTADVLARIGELTQLQYLVLTGSRVTDDVVRGWASLTKLETLRLDATGVTDVALATISKLPSLRKLYLDDLPAASFGKLSQLSRLQRLSVARAELTPQSMSELVKLTELVELDLSGCQLDQATMSVLEQNCPTRLELLRLKNATVDSRALLELARNEPQLRFDIENLDADPQVTDFLVSRDRVIDANDPFMGASMIRFSSGLGNVKRQLGEIDPMYYNREFMSQLQDASGMPSASPLGPPLGASYPPTIDASPLDFFERLGYLFGTFYGSSTTSNDESL